MTDDFYKEFFEKCDLEERSIHQFGQDILEVALSEICAYVSIDFPKGERFNRRQEKDEKLDKGYLTQIPYCNIHDWKIDPSTGKYLWIKEFYEVDLDDDPTAEKMHYYEFKMRKLFKKGDKQFGGWEIWRSQPTKKDINFTDKTKFYEMPKEQVITSIPEINVWCFRINKAYHVGLQLGPICQEFFQRRSFMVANSNKTCVGIGTITLGPDIGAPGDTSPPDVDTPHEASELRRQYESDGWVVLRQTEKWKDDIKIVEAQGSSHKFISDELTKLVESMMQTLRQMNMTASANKKALGRSADSKEIDKHGTSMLLSVYKHDIADFLKTLIEKLATGRDEDIRFTIEGLTIAEPNYKRDDTVKEVATLGIDVLKFPDMWKLKYLMQLATELIESDLTDKERRELSDKFLESIKAGDFEALDPEEAVAAGNYMAPTTAKTSKSKSKSKKSTSNNK
jgi:hypothetical protein